MDTGMRIDPKEVLVQESATTVPPTDGEGSRPREDEIAIVDKNSPGGHLRPLQNRAAIQELANANDWEALVSQILRLKGVPVHKFSELSHGWTRGDHSVISLNNSWTWASRALISAS